MGTYLDWVESGKASLKRDNLGWDMGKDGSALSPQGEKMLHQRRSMTIKHGAQRVDRQGPHHLRLLEDVKNYGHCPKCHGWPHKGSSRMGDVINFQSGRHIPWISYGKNVSVTSEDKGGDERTSWEATRVLREKVMVSQTSEAALEPERSRGKSEIYKRLHWGGPGDEFRVRSRMTPGVLA